jgi:paraquat-inducible protein B
VEYRGIQIGEVVDINLESEGLEMSKVAVAIDIELERCGMCSDPDAEQQQKLELLVEKGLRAQLKFGNLLTGQLYVAVDYYPDEKPMAVIESDDIPVIPTVSADLEGIITNAGRFVARLDKLPIEDIGENIDRLARELAHGVDASAVKQAVKSLDDAMKEIKAAAGRVNTSTLPALDSAMAKLDDAVGDLEKLVDADAPLQYELLRALEELASAARAIRSMADLIERQPESLIRGK